MTNSKVGNTVAPPVSFKTYSPAGDIIAVLPCMRQIYRDTGRKAVVQARLDVEGHYYDGAIHSTYNDKGVAVCMSRKHWEMLVPLLEAQDYVDHCEVWEGQPFDFDLDKMREQGGTNAPQGHLYWWQPLVYPQLATDFTQKFIELPTDPFAVKMTLHGKHTDNIVFSGSNRDILRDKILICRSERYVNQYISYFFLKDFESKVVFTGTRKEYERFCSEWKLNIPYLVVDDFLDLAHAIARCGLFVSNATMSAHIANGLGKRRLIELFPQMANVYPTTKNGFPFMHQVSLEYYIKKIVSEHFL